MTPVRQLLPILTIAVSLAGCATNLVVGETTVLPDAPDGIVVNKRIVYEVAVATKDGLGIKAEPADATVIAVDQHRMLSLNICRQPFSSGKLSVELTPAQTLKNVTLTSESGAARSLDAGKAIVEAATPKKKEDKKKDDGAADGDSGGE